ncbi:MAG: hypothetical protein IJW05_12655 [Lentisphaeria bacterium]|nr:hypothetical protein [Lentisphaeria bacterium]
MELKQSLQKTKELGMKAEKIAAEIRKLEKNGKPVPQKKREALQRAHDQLMRSISASFRTMDRKGPSHFSKDNTWIWGGPTPFWGGSMDPDCALRGAEYFDLDNIVYMYGPTDEETIKLHQPAKKLICQLSEINRSPGVVCGSDAENAELLSKLSLKYPNIKGGMIDDLIGNYGRNLSLKEVKVIYENLKKHNKDLQLYNVVYTHELNSPFIPLIEPYTDAVNLWVGLNYQLTTLDLDIEKCRAAFPGKKIMLGIFIYDYFASANPNSLEFLEIELKRAKKYLAEGKIHDLILMGDREVKKCPAECQFVKDFLQSEFRKGR